MSNIDQWITLKEASEITGRSITSLRLLINRKRIVNVRKIRDKGHGHWLIHKDSVDELRYHKVSYQNDASGDKSSNENMITHLITQIMENFNKQRKEWDEERDKLSHGLMMYQYKLEEYERKMKLLPGPVDVVVSRLEETERRLQEEQVTREGLMLELEAEKKKSWWKKFLGLKSL